jgi:hypothetical protein
MGQETFYDINKLKDFDDYQMKCQAFKSKFYLEESPLQVLHTAAHGMVSEVVELWAKPNDRDELGDVMWYHAVVSSFLGFSLDKIYEEAYRRPYRTIKEDQVTRLLILHVGKFSDLLKKDATKYRERSEAELLNVLVEMACCLVFISGHVHMRHALYIMSKNIEKLNARHQGRRYDEVQ